MIAHVAPANRSCDYSLNSLRYAERLRVVIVRVVRVVNRRRAAAAKGTSARATTLPRLPADLHARHRRRQ